jgi:hypothetical protein
MFGRAPVIPADLLHAQVRRVVDKKTDEFFGVADDSAPAPPKTE